MLCEWGSRDWQLLSVYWLPFGWLRRAGFECRAAQLKGIASISGGPLAPFTGVVGLYGGLLRALLLCRLLASVLQDASTGPFTPAPSIYKRESKILISSVDGP